MGLDFTKPETLQTRCGSQVRIYAIDGEGKFPIHGAFFDGAVWRLANWTTNGGYFLDASNDYRDLLPKPARVTGWMNVYSNGRGKYNTSDTFESQMEARKISSFGCLGQIYIDAEIQQ